jgi:hypothetical protein
MYFRSFWAWFWSDWKMLLKMCFLSGFFFLSFFSFYFGLNLFAHLNPISVIIS